MCGVVGQLGVGVLFTAACGLGVEGGRNGRCALPLLWDASFIIEEVGWVRAGQVGRKLSSTPPLGKKDIVKTNKKRSEEGHTHTHTQSLLTEPSTGNGEEVA